MPADSPHAPPPGMVRIPGGTFLMGSDRHYPEEAPARRVTVAPFWIDETPVTNARFRAFVQATGHVTAAETPPRPGDNPGASAEMLRAGSLTFRPGAGWAYAFGADWRHPGGPGTGLDGLDDHPVVHVTHADALAFAAWADADLPTEAEWEFAARGGLDGAEFAWGDEFTPGGRHMANTWQGLFPDRDLGLDGWRGTSPVRAFPANGFGLFDMIGNCWEWTRDRYVPRPAAGQADRLCCGPASTGDGTGTGIRDAAPTDLSFATIVIKGGSHLCAPNWCRRYRPAARQPQTADSATGHISFRCVRRIP